MVISQDPEMGPIVSNIPMEKSPLSPVQMLQAVLDKIRNVVPCAKQYLYLVLNHERLKVYAPDDLPPPPRRFIEIMGIPLEKVQISLEQAPQLKQAAQQQAPLLVSPQELTNITSGLIQSEQAKSLQRAGGYHSLLFQPLARPQGTLGFLLVSLDEATPSADILSKIRDLSTMAANALDLIYASEALETAHKQMAAMHAVSLRVSRSLDLQQVMQQAVIEVSQVLQVEAAAISVIEPESGDLVIKAQHGLHKFAHTPVRIPKDKGLAWQTIKTKQHLIIDSWDDEPRLAVPEFREEHVSTTILVPMLTAGGPVGVLSAMSRSPRHFSEQEIQLLSSISDHVAIALQHAYLHEETRRQSHERAFLFDLAAAIAPHQDIESIAQEALQRTLDFLAWPIGVFLVEDTLSGALVPQARMGDSAILQKLIRRIRETAYEQNLLNPLSLHHASTYPQTVIQIPIQAHYHTLGWLILGHPEHIEVSAATQEALITESKHLGVAVENAQLYQETVEREKSSRALYQITRAMTGHDLRDMLKQILEELYNGIPYQASGILLTSPQNIEILRLRVVITPDQLTDLQKHLHTTLGDLEPSSKLQAQAEDTQIIIRGQEEGTWDTQTLLSYLEVPIIQDNVPIGAMLLARPQPFQTRDQRMLFILAYQLSKVLTTIQLFQQAQAQSHQLEESNILLKAQESTQANIYNQVAQALRTPTTFIQSYAELLREETAGRLNKNQDEALNILQEKAMSLSRMVRELSMIKTVTPENLHLQSTDLLPLLQQCAAQAEVAVTETQKVLQAQLDAALPRIEVAPNYLKQAIDHLLSIAITLSDPNSTILLAAKSHSEHQVRVAITYKCTEAPQEEVHHMFESIYPSWLGRKYPGIGISLTLAKRIITAHQGDIGVEQPQDKTYTLYFLIA